MISKGTAKKVTIYVNEDTRSHHGPLYEAVMRFLLDRGVSGATATRCLAGFGSHHQLHTPKIEALSEHMPIRIEFIETAERVDISGATVYRGVLGYGAKGHTHREHFLHISKDLPVMISVVDAPENIAKAAEAIETVIEEGLIVFSEVEYVRLVRPKVIPE